MDLINKILETEKDADVIIDEAHDKARIAVQKSKRDAEVIISKALSKAQADVRDILKAADEKIQGRDKEMQALMSEKRAAIRKDAAKKFDKAVSFIVKNVGEKWQ